MEVAGLRSLLATDLKSSVLARPANAEMAKLEFVLLGNSFLPFNLLEGD